MIKDATIDQCLVELARTMKALKALRNVRKEEAGLKTCQNHSCWAINSAKAVACCSCGGGAFYTTSYPDRAEHAAAKRASLDLTHKLAALRGGR